MKKDKKKRERGLDFDAKMAGMKKKDIDSDSEVSNEELDEEDKKAMAMQISTQPENPAQLIDLDLVNLLKYCH